MRNLEKGQHIFIAFQNGKAVLDSQLRPRMYTSIENADRWTPTIDKGKIEYVEYAPTLTPQHESLTIEQLREMVGEPIYLKVFDPLLESGWHIIKAVTEDKIIFRGWQTVYVPIDGMGVDYNLYRRPPEGEEDTS